jgi:hypothetical protein
MVSMPVAKIGCTLRPRTNFTEKFKHCQIAPPAASSVVESPAREPGMPLSPLKHEIKHFSMKFTAEAMS